MAEYISTIPQELTAGQPVALQNNTVSGGCQIMHRAGSPLISVRGSGCCKAPNLYRVMVHVTVEAPAAAVVQLAIAVDGVTFPETLISLPQVAAGTILSGSTELLVPADCGCSKISIVAVTDATVNSAIVIVSKE